MAKFLDPKADLTFKKMVPLTPLHKDTIVDVRCKDMQGRQFVSLGHSRGYHHAGHGSL